MANTTAEPAADPETKAPKTFRRRAARVVVTVSIVAIALILVLVAAGVAYTYFIGTTPVKMATAPVATKPQTNLPAASRAPAADAAIGVSIQTLSSPVAPGENSYVAIKTLPTADCTIDVEYNKVKATDSGLVAKTADEYGVTSWSWTVPTGTPLGSWPVTITCAHGERDAVVAGTLVVANPESN